jgi:hypothetical protein
VSGVRACADVVRDADLADVMQLSRLPDAGHVGRRYAELLAHCARQVGGRDEPLGPLRVAFVDRAQKRVDGLREAVRHSAQVAITLRETRHRPGLAEALRLLGHSLQQSGRQDDAHACWQEALALFDDIGMPEGATVRALLADVR